MRKILYVFLGVVVMLAMTACGSTQEEGAEVVSLATEESGENVQENIISEQGLTQECDMESVAKKEEDVLETQADDLTQEEEVMTMNVQVGNSIFTATLESNEAVDALVEMLENGPLTISMSDYSGFEKVGSLGTSLPKSNSQTTTQAGDIVLYNGNQIVIFYGSNSWSYTKLGKIDDLTRWEDALGSGDVEVTFSID